MKCNILKNITFHSKIVASHITIAFIPLLIFALVSWSVFINEAKDTVDTHAQLITGQASNLIDVYISTIEKLADYVAVDIKAKKVLDDPVQWDLQKDEMQQLLDEVAASHPEVGGILIANRGDQYISTGMTRISRDPFENEYWYKQAKAMNGGIVLISKAIGRNIVTNREYSSDNVFSISKAVLDENGDTIGVILFDVKHTIIQQAINQVSEGDSEFVFITDNENDIVYAPVNEIVYRIDPSWLDDDGSHSVKARIKGIQYQISYERSKYTGWKTIGVFSVNKIMSGVNSIIWILILCIILSTSLIIFVTVALTNSITKPISKLQKLMHSAEQGDLTVRFDMPLNDEIGNLGHSFNTMINRIDELMKQVYREQKSKRDAEIKTLQEQIKPHFLYNTLDTISWMARDYDAENIVKLVDALTSMFRIALSKGEDTITLRDEVTHVSNYLYIQKIRYGNKLNYEVKLDNSLEKCKVPKLILQPLVENAIYHGIKKKRSAGHINVFVKENYNGCYADLIVEDDGAGMTDEKCKQLTNLLRNNIQWKEHGFGIYYIAQRMKLNYENNYNIIIESKEDIGTRIVIEIPLNNDSL